MDLLLGSTNIMAFRFYDSTGKEIAYTDDGEHIFSFSGRPVAYLFENSIYSFSGKHLGFLKDGIVRNNIGEVVFFTKHPTITLQINPMDSFKAKKEPKSALPEKAAREAPPKKPSDSSAWSVLSGSRFFETH